MLFLDHVEGVLAQDGSRFREILKMLNQSCANLSLLLTSDEWLGLSGDVETTNMFILELDPVSSVNFFIDNSREFKPEEVYDLVLEHKGEAFKVACPGEELLEGESLSDEQKRKLLSALREGRDTRIKVLAAHDLFLRLKGCPYSI